MGFSGPEPIVGPFAVVHQHRAGRDVFRRGAKAALCSWTLGRPLWAGVLVRATWRLPISTAVVTLERTARTRALYLQSARSPLPSTLRLCGSLLQPHRSL